MKGICARIGWGIATVFFLHLYPIYIYIYTEKEEVLATVMYNITANILILNKEFLSLNLVISPHIIATL